MKIRTIQEKIGNVKDEIIIAGVFEETKVLSGAASTIDKLTRGMLKEVLDYGDFSGKLYKTLMLYVKKGLQTKRVLLVGLGKEQEFNLDKLRGAASSAACCIRDFGLKSFVVPFSFVQTENIISRDKAAAFVEGILLGLYKFDDFKSNQRGSRQNRINSATILVNSMDELKKTRIEAGRAGSVARAVCTARDLVSRPGNSATPSFLAETARSMAKASGLIFKVLDEKGIKKLGMGAFSGVAQGSNEPARFIVLEHKPARKKVPSVVLIGKAITFDSGGISLKPAGKMEEMKTDMAGGAAVLGTLQAVAELNLPVHVIGIVPATENLPSGRALKPGDIVKSMSGKTIEVISTDAEGRLILCDALTYAARYKPSAVIDLATLTGACIIALGNDVTAVMGNDEKLIGKIRKAADTTGERVWQLPLWQEYGELIKSDIADIKNAGGRPAGTITAGYFLKEFAGDIPWAHLDIAGTAWTDRNKPYVPKGASGVGVRLLVEMLEKW